jgi:hypothetical protein
MHSFLKCQRCDWVDYLEGNYGRCPECGSRTESVEKLFAGEKITCTIMSMARRKTKVPITFGTFTERFNKIITDIDLDALFATEVDRYKMNFMMRSYIWTILKRQPQLWIHVNLVIKGLKELMILKQLNQK